MKKYKGREVLALVYLFSSHTGLLVDADELPLGQDAGVLFPSFRGAVFAEEDGAAAAVADW